MKIFGKRTKKPVSAEEAAKLALISEADKAALELLKKDPSTLNAKQRRMIKRYEERREEEKVVEEKKIDDEDSGEGDDENSAENDEAAKTENEGESGSSVNESSDDGDDDEGDKPPPAKKTKTKKSSNIESTPPIAIAESSTVEAQVDDATEQVQDIKVAEDSKPTATVSSDEEAEILKLVASLNSKNRRKLTRQLEREGPSALAAVKEEALKLAEEGKPVEEVPPEPEPKGKKRKVDWSVLTPEERMRRQDQQRKQQEAAEKRAKGESSEGAHKHALNSERRRANKRKPKWQRMGAPLNTHDTSGFQMRKSSTKVGSGKVVAKT
jgi:hypothetical protein